MLDVLAFVLSRLFRRNFWFLVVSVFFIVLAGWLRSAMRDQIYQDAMASTGKQVGKWVANLTSLSPNG